MSVEIQFKKGFLEGYSVFIEDTELVRLILAFAIKYTYTVDLLKILRSDCQIDVDEDKVKKILNALKKWIREADLEDVIPYIKD